MSDQSGHDAATNDRSTIKRTRQIPPLADHLAELSAAAAAISREQDWSPEVEYKVTLAIEEIGLNIINYSGIAPDRLIDCIIEATPDKVAVTFRDEGHEFNPLTDTPPADTDSEMSDRKVGGLGVFLVATMLDEVEYEYQGGRNVLTVVAHHPR